MFPIPRTLLPDTATVYLRDPDSDYEGSYLEPTEMRYVRFERAEQLSGQGYKLTDGATGRVWIDKANTIGAMEVPAGSKLVIGGEPLKVAKCMPHRDMLHIHHWELDVI